MPMRTRAVAHVRTNFARLYFAAAAGAGPGVMKSSTAFQLPSACFL